MVDSPNVVVVAGPNGSGKSTAAPALLLDYLQIREFVNADTIAAGLSAFNSDSVALRAGEIMLRRFDELARQRADFAFETTLASRSLARRLKALRASSYEIHLIFLWLPTPELAVSRVAARVQQGGHDVPEETVRRRYESGLRNLFQIYIPLVNSWKVFDNAAMHERRLIAAWSEGEDKVVADESIWNDLLERFGS